MVNYLGSTRYGKIWVDVEQCDGCWSGDLNYNCQFVKSIVDKLKSMGVSVGIYTSHYEWPTTVGDCDLSQYPLWWGKCKDAFIFVFLFVLLLSVYSFS